LSFAAQFASFGAMSRLGAYIVTGAGSGIGQAISQKIVENGHHVFGLGRDPKKLESTSRLVGAEHFKFASVDLSREDDSSRVSHEIMRWLSTTGLPLLGLVNNAGVVDRLSFTQTSDKIWERQFYNNLLSAVRLTRDFYGELKKSAPSSVLNVSSTLGRRPIANTSAYSALKAAMINWSQCLALEWAADQIRVNCLCPGIVDTPIHSFHTDAPDSDTKKQWNSLQPLGRMGSSAEMAEAAWFLLSEKSSWTTGTVLSVDGGIGL